jgi:hypothetical protein
MSSKITIAERNGQLVHISEVDSGLSNCVCLNCKGLLIARKGEINEHHFAHYKVDCGIHFETQLHLAVKTILREENKIRLPERDLFFYYDTVKIEKRLKTIAPDIFIKNDQEEIIIEVTVAHACDDLKIAKIREINISALEIDLSKINRETSISELRKIVIENINYKKWLYKKMVFNDVPIIEKEKIKTSNDEVKVADTSLLEVIAFVFFIILLGLVADRIPWKKVFRNNIKR